MHDDRDALEATMASLLRRTGRHAPRISLLQSSSTRRSVRLYTSPSSSVNPDEIAHFSKLSSEWWDERGEFSFLHKMNPVRMQFIRQKLLEVQQDANAEMEVEDIDVLDGLDVLDVGCGGGLLSEVRSFCVTLHASVNLTTVSLRV